MITWVTTFKNLDGTRQRTTEHGVTVYENQLGENRYEFDSLCTAESGWQQFDTKEDASWFGIWAHKEEHLVVIYAEGDAEVHQFPDENAWKAQLKTMREQYGPPPHQATIIDTENREATRIYGEQPG